MALGFPHPDFLLPLLSSRQVAEWQAYYAVEPFGEMPAWLRAGVITSTIANVHRDPRKGRTFSPEDFMPKEPKLATPPVKQTVEQQRQELMRIFEFAKRRGLAKIKKRET